MSYFNIVAQTNENTVVTEYEPVKKRSDSYQSEAALENEFIHMLEEQGYEYLSLHTEDELVINLRKQLEKLNNYSFTDKEWKQLPDFPGDARVQPVLAAIEKDNDTLLYVLGGFFGGDATKTPTMGEKVLAFSLKQQQWHEVALQENPNKEIFSLTGATALAIDNRYIACFGGVNHSLFINTITDLYHLGKDTSLTDEQRKQKNYDYMSHYMTQPIAYYKFNQECYLFDTHTKQWSVLNIQPDFARAGATLVGTPSEFYL